MTNARGAAGLFVHIVTVAFLLLAAPHLNAAAPPTPPMNLPRTSAAITVDGNLDDAGWKDALVIDKFYEAQPGDNIEPKVKTTAWVTYDDKYFYIGLKCDDPDPKKIRAPFVDRDQVIGTDDNIAIFLDTTNEKKIAYELRVNPRGIQGDGIFNDATGNEDFSPDFFYDTAAKITSEGWQAEMRIPFSSLRYPENKDPQTWGIFIWRNYPRDYRYAIYSTTVERGTNCLVCHVHELTGLTHLPAASHIVAAPYVTAEQLSHRTDPSDLSSPFTSDNVKTDAGADVKWIPAASTTVDMTLNPDFSQIESDVAQISANERFALFFPEKRPFFLEGIDLFQTPIQAVYTRSITSPRWGVRGTGTLGSNAYTVLVSEDRGGGLVILPGPLGSSFAPQDFSSTATIGRVRHDFAGKSYLGALVSDREYSGGGYNRVLGPDFQWRPSQSDSVTGQFLFSSTENPDHPDISAAWNGQRASSHAADVSWSHQTRTYDSYFEARDFGNDFRADNGFVPQNGFREGYANAGYTFYANGLLRQIRTYLTGDYMYDRDNNLINRTIAPGVFMIGRRNLNVQLEARPKEKIDTGEKLLTQSYGRFAVQIDPNRRLSRIALSGKAGEAIDFANSRVGHGVTLQLTSTIRPIDRLQFDVTSEQQWLNVDGNELSGRLFTAQVQRLKTTYSFSARSLVRVIGQYVTTKRNPALYTFPVSERDGAFLGSILYSYKINWQTVLFLGYGDDRVVTENNDIIGTNRSVFLKVSYALQR